MIINNIVLNQINSPVRTITAKVELYEGSTLVDTYTERDRLIKLTVERVGEGSKFFGLGIVQKANIHLIDKNRELDITTANGFKIYFNGVNCLPAFHVTEVHRDEKTNELSITAYDALYAAASRTVSELEFAMVDGQTSYTIGEFAGACASLLSIAGPVFTNIDDMSAVNRVYDNGANFDGTEDIRSALTSVAEATQTVYFLGRDNILYFKRLDQNASPVLTIDKSKYFELESGDNRRLATVYHTTELGDDVYTSTAASGSTQYVRNNPFWDMRDDIGTIVDNALAAIGGLTIGQFNCQWRGNFLLELGDKIGLVTRDNTVIYSYLLDDVITYDGTYSQKTQWTYSDNELETSANPTSLGDALKKTYARVDKANQQIDLVASTSAANGEAIAALEINTKNINQYVEEMQKDVEGSFEGIEGTIDTLTKRVEQTMTAEAVTTTVKTILEQDGVSKVITTSSRFDEDGLTIAKDGSELTTTMSHDGMVIKRDEMEVLKVDNQGVNAANLHATTYLIIGTNSRFEDYQDTRTGCFWIGN